MEPFDLQRSMEKAQERFRTERRRQPRRDRGQSRLAPELLAEVERLLSGYERPTVPALLEQLRDFARARGLRPPSRATLYELMATLPAERYAIGTLPPAVRQALFNLPEEGVVPGHQLAFHCFNYGGLDALSFAAGLPWLALYQAARTRGWRARSRGLLASVMAARGI